MWKDYECLKAKDLVTGNCYVDKSGVVTIYIGKLSDNRYVFYDLFCMILSYDNYVATGGCEVYPRDKKLAIKLACEYSKLIFNTPFRFKEARVVRTLPKLFGCIGTSANIQTVLGWITKSRLLREEEIPKIYTSNENLKKDSIWVSSKDLIVGAFYFGGQSPYRNTFCYLGRTKDKGYIWYFIGNEKAFLGDPDKCIVENVFNDISITRSNKKVRLLTSEYNNVIGGHKISISPHTERWLETRYNKKLQ